MADVSPAMGNLAGRMRRWVETHLDRSRRYVPVAIICALLHNSIMIGLDHVGVHYALCQVASAAVLTPVGYLLQSRLTFAVERSWREFGRYSAALVTNYPVAIAVLWLLCDVLSLHMVWASPISMVVLFMWNYATAAWAFSRRAAPQEAVHG